MDGIEQMIQSLPPEAQEMLVKRIAILHPEFLEQSIATLASVKYTINVNVVVSWEKNATNKIDKEIRGKIREEIEERNHLLVSALVEFLGLMDLKRIESLHDLLEESKKI